MFYYKVNNLKNNLGDIDYKGLDIKKNLPGSQIYPLDLQKYNYCILANSEDITHEDLIELTEEEYLQLKDEILAEYPPTPEEKENTKIAELETALLEMSTLSAIQQAQTEQVIMELTMMIGGM